MKLVHNISFHWHRGQLEFHLNHILNWDSSSNSEYVLTSAHKENLEWAKDFIAENYIDKKDKFHYIVISEDHGHHLGTTFNVTEGLKYVRDNLDYDFVINSEADFMFWDESKMLKLVNKLEIDDKHMLIMDHYSQFGVNLKVGPWNNVPPYMTVSTLNVYSKSMIDNYFPFEYYKDVINFGWCGESGTPFEAYLGMAFAKKNKLDTEKKVLDFFSKYAHGLEYDFTKGSGIEEPVGPIPLYDRFLKYGIIGMLNAQSHVVGVGKEREDSQWKISVCAIDEIFKDRMYDFD